MIETVQLKGFDEYVKYTQNMQGDGSNVVFYFTGSKTEDGKSWCPDCNEVEPAVKAYLEELNKPLIFVYVDVGDMPYWKDRLNPFRTDKVAKLMVIPTLMKYKGVQRLEGTQCGKRELLQIFFEDDN